MNHHHLNVKLLSYRIIALSVALFGIGYRFIDTFVRNGFLPSLNLLGYFTIQSGLMIIAMFIVLIVNQLKGNPENHIKPGLRGAVLLYALVTSIIFLTMLNDKVDMSGFSYIVLYVNHFLTALLLGIDHLFTLPAGSYQWKHVPHWLIYPMSYLAFTLIESAIAGRYRYFFLNYAEYGLPFYLLNVVFLTLVFVALSSLMILVNRRLKKVES